MLTLRPGLVRVLLGRGDPGRDPHPDDRRVFGRRRGRLEEPARPGLRGEEVAKDRAEPAVGERELEVETGDLLAPPFVVDPPDVLDALDGDAPPLPDDGD